ncbi:MAG TPA: hypothetical protein VMZ91_01985 [Candidatus Paceibacterota bacterium]|nr:hypothetical protein [Candidatus Paceibacterota bacterium]
MKICSICGVEKDFKNFYFRKDSQRYRNECKKCHNIRSKDCYENNKNEISLYNKNRYQQVNKDEIKQKNKIYYKNNKEKIKEQTKKYNETHKKEKKEYIKKYNETHKEEKKEYNKKYNKKYRKEINEYKKQKYKTDPKIFISRNISSVIRHSLKGNKNGYHWEDIVGYTLEQLIEHLESNSEFTIQDYLEKDLHLDHIIPISVYSFSSYEDKEFFKCWNLRNLRLITAEENLSKGNKLDMKLIKKYEIIILLPKNYGGN